MDTKMEKLVGGIALILKQKSWHLATAESCTGGLVSHMLTNVSGSSDWFMGGVVSYSNKLKVDLLHVPEQILLSQGAVSESCVMEMAAGVCRLAGTQTGIAISGIAGPTGGSAEKPVGTVWIAWQVEENVFAKGFQFDGLREEIKEQSAKAALEGLLLKLKS